IPPPAPTSRASPRSLHDALPISAWGRPFARLVQMFASRRHRAGRPGQRVGEAFEHLGPVAIKLGQVLATRADIFGLQFAQDLGRSEEHTSELQSRENLVCRLLLE